MADFCDSALKILNRERLAFMRGEKPPTLEHSDFRELPRADGRKGHSGRHVLTNPDMASRVAGLLPPKSRAIFEAQGWISRRQWSNLLGKQVKDLPVSEQWRRMLGKLGSITFTDFEGSVCYSSSKDRHPDCRDRKFDDAEYEADDEEGLEELLEALAEGDTEGACEILRGLFFGAWWGIAAGAEIESVDSLGFHLNFREE